MSADKTGQRSEADAALESEILKERKFTLEEAIGRMIGPGGMKGASPVARMQQAEAEIETWLRTCFQNRFCCVSRRDMRLIIAM
jgi:hypothetical protein